MLGEGKVKYLIKGKKCEKIRKKEVNYLVKVKYENN